MIYNCTKDFLKAIKVESVKKPDIYNELFSWNVKLIKIGRRNLVYLMNDASKLSIVLYGLTAKEFRKFDGIVKEALKDVLIDCKVSNQVAQNFIDDLGMPTYTTSGSKKQLGVLNRAAMEVQYFFDEYVENQLLQRGLCDDQNNGFVKNDKDNYVKPAELVKNLLEKAYVDNQVTYDLEEIAIHMFMGDRLDMESFLNIKNGSIFIAESGSEDYEDIEFDDDYIHIRTGYYDFFTTFYRFADSINNLEFNNDLERHGHGSGAIRRIKELLSRYPEIERQWFEYKDELEKQMVKEWLETLGLI